MLPAEKVRSGEFRKQVSLPSAGDYPVNVKLSVDGNEEQFNGLQTVTVKDDVKKVKNLSYTADSERKKADLVWESEGNIEFYKIKYGTNRENLRLSLTVATLSSMLILADATIPYYAQVFPVDENGVVNGEASEIVMIAPAAVKVPVCGDGLVE